MRHAGEPQVADDVRGQGDERIGHGGVGRSAPRANVAAARRIGDRARISVYSRPAQDADLGRPDELASRARDAARDREPARRAATRSRSPPAISPRRSGCCERFGIEHTAIGRHRGGRLGAKALGLGRAIDGAHAMGPRPPLRPGPGPRLQRHHDRRGAPADPLLDDVRLRVGDGPAQRQLPARRGRRGPRRDPAGTALPLRRPRQDPRLSRAQGGVLPGGLRTGPARSSTELGLDRDRPIAVVRTPPEVSLYHRFENDLFAQVLDRLADAQTVVLPRTPEQRAELERAGALHRPRAGDRRPVADRVRGRGRVGRRDDEPRSGGARNAGLHGVRGTPGGGRRAADRRGPAAAPDQPPIELEIVKPKPEAHGQDRVRRDPALLADLLLGAWTDACVDRGDPGATFARLGRVRVLNRSRRPSVSRTTLEVPSARRRDDRRARVRADAAAPPAPRPRRSRRTRRKGAWSFVSAPKLHPPKLRPTRARRSPSSSLRATSWSRTSRTWAQVSR